MTAVSVIIPTHNRASLIVDSIQSVLNQTYTDYEIIIVDDGSTDNTAQVVDQFRSGNIRYIYQEKQGVSAARNRGIRAAAGPYIAFLDSDDFFLPQKLELQVRLFEQKPELGMVYSSYMRVDEHGGYLDVRPATVYANGYKEMLIGCTVAAPTVMVARAVLEHVGVFDEVMQLAEDIDLWCRIFRHYPIEAIQEPLAKVRIHAAGTPRDPEAVLDAYMHLLMKAFRADSSLTWSYRRRALAKMHYLCASEVYSLIDPQSSDPQKYRTFDYYYTKAARYWPFSRLGIKILLKHYTRGPRAVYKKIRGFLGRLRRKLNLDPSYIEEMRHFHLETIDRYLDLTRELERLRQQIGGQKTVSAEWDPNNLEAFAVHLTSHLEGNEAYPVFHKHGYHLLKRHFYLPIPEADDRRYLKPGALPGMNLNDVAALDLLDEVVTPYKREFNSLPVHLDDVTEKNGFYLLNSAFMAIDGNIYYGLIRKCQPGRIVEIGSGFSTLLAATAARRNAEEGGAGTEIVCIEPYPSDLLLSLKDTITLIPKKVQEVGVEFFSSLGENDILFIDSSHTLREGGDVWYEYCEILPRLSSGVLVHVHDISLPNPYPSVYFERQVFWNEQYLLQAFLTFNSRFEIIWPGNYLMLKYPEKMQGAFTPEYDLMRGEYPFSEPSSFWMRVQSSV